MIIRMFLLTVLALCFASASLAIEPVYEGEDGIRNKVFASNCLACHASNLVGVQRNGAPAGLNWDVYETSKDRGNRIIVRAVQQMSMPPSFSSVPALNQEQKNALTAWQQAGFPRIMEMTEAANYDFSTLALTLPVVHVGDLIYKAVLQLVERPGSPTGFGFQLVMAELVETDSPTAAIFNTETGVVLMPEIQLLNGDAVSDKVSAEMGLVEDNPALIFDLISIEFL